MIQAYGSSELRAVEWHIAHYYEIKKAVHETRLEQKRRSGAAERRSVGYVSDPTATEALKNLEKLKSVTVPGCGAVKEPEAWIEVIERVMASLEREDQRLIEATFWESHTWEGAIERTHLNKMTYYRRRDRLIAAFAIAAATKGLIAL